MAKRPFTDEELTALVDRVQELTSDLHDMRARWPYSIGAEPADLENAARAFNRLAEAAVMFNAEALATIANLADARKLRARLQAELKG